MFPKVRRMLWSSPLYNLALSRRAWKEKDARGHARSAALTTEAASEWGLLQICTLLLPTRAEKQTGDHCQWLCADSSFQILILNMCFRLHAKHGFLVSITFVSFSNIMSFIALGREGVPSKPVRVWVYAFYVSIRRKRDERAKKPAMAGLPLTPSSQSLIPQTFIQHLLCAQRERIKRWPPCGPCSLVICNWMKQTGSQHHNRRQIFLLEGKEGKKKKRRMKEGKGRKGRRDERMKAECSRGRKETNMYLWLPVFQALG